MSTTPDPNPARIDGLSNVLLLAPTVGQSEATACGRLSSATDPETSHLVLVSGLKSPTEQLADWDEHAGARPAETTVVDVSGSARSATAAQSGGSDLWPEVTVERVPGGDLLALGETIDSVLTRSCEPPLVCVRSVTDLLQSADEDDVFRFLEVLTGTVDRAGGTGHYHLDPDVHDPETVRTLAVLFDAVVDLREGESERA